MRCVCGNGQVHAFRGNKNIACPFRLNLARRRGHKIHAASSLGKDAHAQPFVEFLASTQLGIIQVSIGTVQAWTVLLPSFQGSCFRDIELPVQAAEELDGGGSFKMEPWDRPEGSPNPGHGITAVLEGGTLLEKVSHLLPQHQRAYPVPP